MPYGLHRYQQAGSLHFITFSCFHRLPYLAKPEAKSIVEAVLEKTRQRHTARIYAYVLMPEHVHLVINEPPVISLSQWIKVFKQTCSRELKRDQEPFWQDRYFDRNIASDEMTEVVQYIHRNPVKRGLAADPREYAWSSYRHYATGDRGVVEIESEWTARWRETHSSR